MITTADSKQYRNYSVGWDSSVGIGTRYWLDGPGIESEEARFSEPVQPGSGAQAATHAMGTGFLSRK